MNLDKIKINKIIKGIIVFALFWYSTFFQYIPIYLFKLDTKNISLSTQCLLSLFSGFVVAILFIVIYWKDLKRDFITFKRNFFKYMDESFKYWILGLFVMCFSNILIRLLFHTNGANNENALQELIKALPWAMFISAAITGPFNEEIVFRKTLIDVFKNKWVVTFLSFLLFGGAHVILNATVWTDYLYIIPYGALGAAFAYADCKCENIIPSIFMHITHNTVLLLISIFSLTH